MFVVIFQVSPRREQWEAYLGLARLLKPELEKIPGFIDNERFASRRTKGQILSLSSWADEKALIRWRTQALHHQVQEQGRAEVFADYQLRIGEVTSDTDITFGSSLRQTRYDETETGAARLITLIETVGIDRDSGDSAPIAPGARGPLDAEWYDSIYTAGKALLLSCWRDSGDFERDQASHDPAPAEPGAIRVRRRVVRIIRDYGMFDRREAPQYYPPAKRES
jgi:heme-degrading monooxygenase HmoA